MSGNGLFPLYGQRYRHGFIPARGIRRDFNDDLLFLLLVLRLDWTHLNRDVYDDALTCTEICCGSPDATRSESISRSSTLFDACLPSRRGNWLREGWTGFSWCEKIKISRATNIRSCILVRRYLGVGGGSFLCLSAMMVY